MMKHFHVHIYFEDKDKTFARTLAKNAGSINSIKGVKFHEHPVGPHPTGMIELQFSEPVYNKVVDWVEANRGDLSALIHEDTGDDFRDHTEGARWLGLPLKLDFTFFELIQKRPELRINRITFKNE
jgi:aromatic ring-cleaving dioxygenase